MTSFAFILGCVPLAKARRRCARAPGHGVCRHRRNARRVRHRDLPHAGDVLRNRAPLLRKEGCTAARKSGALVGLGYPRVGAVTVASSVFGETPVSILNSGHSLCAKLDTDSILLF
jgi:hypothetical protein